MNKDIVLGPWVPASKHYGKRLTGGFARYINGSGIAAVVVQSTSIPDRPDKYEYDSYEEYLKAHEVWEQEAEKLEQSCSFVIGATACVGLNILKEDRCGSASSPEEAMKLADQKLGDHNARFGSC